jgi:hypothetical protein
MPRDVRAYLVDVPEHARLGRIQRDLALLRAEAAAQFRRIEATTPIAG